MRKSKLALKRLTGSDLSIFEYHFRANSAWHQKALNLNRKIFVDMLFPSLPDVADDYAEKKFPLDLNVFGPDAKGLLNLQRKIVKSERSKNWRLNGEVIHNPEVDLSRFNILQANDVVLLEFTGSVVPTSANMYLIASASTKDSAIYKALDHVLGTKKMASVTHEMIQSAISSTNLSQEHPLYNLMLDEALEDAALGGAEGMEKLWKGISRTRLSQDALQKAKKNAEDIGRAGEEIIDTYLQEQLKQGVIGSYEWTAKSNAVAPYDFKVASEECTLLDVKATSGDFGRNIHISLNELRQMTQGDLRYDLYRVYSVNEENAKLRIAKNLKEFATAIVKVLDGLPAGTLADSISVDPTTLAFGQEFTLSLKSDEEED